MSDILTLYDNLAVMAVTVGSTTPSVRDLHQLTNSAEVADLPVRLLLPVGTFTAGAPGGDTYTWLEFSQSTAQIRWQVRDLLLWDALAQGRGIADYAQDLVDYCGAYCEALRTLTVTADTFLLTASVTPGVYEYPDGSGVWYFGVEALLTFTEYLQ